MPLPRTVWWVLGAGAGAVALASLARADDRDRKRTVQVGPRGENQGLDKLVEVMSRADAPLDWKIFFAAIAHRESRWNSDAWNQSSSEIRASEIAFERTQDRYAQCKWPASAYQIGSGGYFGLIPANALSAFWGTRFQCVSPNTIFDPEMSFVMAIDMAVRLTRYGTFDVNPTWLNLNRGWRSPSSMGAVVPASDRRFRESLEALRNRGWSVPFGWEDETVKNMGSIPDTVALVERLKGGKS